MRQARVALILSLALIVIVGALTLTRSPLRVVRVSVKPEGALASTTGTPTVCQADEILPRGVSAIRLGLEASFGPKVLLRAYSHSRVLTAGNRASDWTGSSVTVPVKPLGRTVSYVKVCFSVPTNDGLLQLYGVPTGTRQAAVEDEGHPLPGRVNIEYMTPSGNSWWSRAVSLGRHIGVGHAISGTWVALLLATLMVAVISLVIGLAWRDVP